MVSVASFFEYLTFFEVFFSISHLTELTNLFLSGLEVRSTPLMFFFQEFFEKILDEKIYYMYIHLRVFLKREKKYSHSYSKPFSVFPTIFFKFSLDLSLSLKLYTWYFHLKLSFYHFIWKNFLSFTRLYYLVNQSYISIVNHKVMYAPFSTSSLHEHANERIRSSSLSYRQNERVRKISWILLWLRGRRGWVMLGWVRFSPIDKFLSVIQLYHVLMH